MDQKIVLVTGASSGIGREVALKLAEAHQTVVLTARRREILEQLEREISARGRRVVAIQGDVTREGEVRHIVKESLKTFGAVDALVHCAGWGTAKPLSETSSDDFRRMIDSNLTSAYYLLKLLVPHFLKREKGQIVAVSSIAGKAGFPNHTAYCASKFGLMGLLAALRAEVQGKGITVTSICPGATDTPYWDDVPGDWPREKMMDPSTVADAVLFALNQPAAACVEELVIQPAGGPL